MSLSISVHLESEAAHAHWHGRHRSCCLHLVLAWGAGEVRGDSADCFRGRDWGENSCTSWHPWEYSIREKRRGMPWRDQRSSWKWRRQLVFPPTWPRPVWRGQRGEEQGPQYRGPSWHCFAIPWGWHSDKWWRGWAPHYGIWRTICQQRRQWEEAPALGTWPGEVLVTPQLIELQGWEGSTRVILASRRGAQYHLLPPSTTSSPRTKSLGGGVPDCGGCLCSAQTSKLLAIF